jgi:hypothetical protein
MTVNVTKCQMIVRNGKTFWFFPDITVDDLTKGFLVDIGSPFVEQVQALWNEYCGTGRSSYFSVYLNIKLEDARVHQHIYSMYQSLPSSQVEVIGMAVPKQSVIIKKRRIASL